jgi:hypothetical protein
MNISKTIEVKYRRDGPWIPRSAKGCTLVISHPEMQYGIDCHPNKIGEYNVIPLLWTQGETTLTLETSFGDRMIYDVRVKGEKSFRENEMGSCEVIDGCA